jgi:hypothetical protein
VLAWSKAYPDDFEKVWGMVNQKWDKREPCPEGALNAFNIDAKLNGAYVALGLLYGKGDMAKTLEVATRSGQDSDCNPASAGGILGVMLGYSKIPEQWKSGIPAIADKKFSYTDFTFKEIVSSTEKRALDLVRAAGGKVSDDSVEIPMERAKPTPVPLWDDYGSPVERVKTTDARWQWKGNWSADPRQKPDADRPARIASAAGAEVTVAFEGTGAILTGTYLPKGGTATVYLDGKMDRTVDVCSDEDSNRGGEAVWHAFGLKNGKHTLRFVVDGKPGPGSDSTTVIVDGLVTFR